MINKLCLLFIKFVHRDECENSKGIGITFGFVSRDDDHIFLGKRQGVKIRVDK